MKYSNCAVLTAIFLAGSADAFAPSFGRRTALMPASVQNAGKPLFVSSSTMESPANGIEATNGAIRSDPSSMEDIQDPEIARLKHMAQQLRAEAAALEAQRQEELAAAAQKAFDKFDTNKDGKITLEELKDGLKRTLKDIEVPDYRAEQLMAKFDASGDGALQIDEFVTVDKFRNQLEALAREERRQATLAQKMAREEEEQAKMLQAVAELINEKEPTATDKIVSVLPYLFPLMDVLPFGQYILQSNPENPIAILLATMFAVYRSIPLAGFISFFALSFLAGDVSINRLIRFNMRQAIFLDIALFFPSLVASVTAFVLGLAGNQVQLPEAAVVASSSAIFLSVLAVVAYSSVSSLAGATPDKVPFLSDAVKARMPTQEMLMDAAKSGNLSLPWLTDKDGEDDESKR